MNTWPRLFLGCAVILANHGCNQRFAFDVNGSDVQTADGSSNNGDVVDSSASPDSGTYAQCDSRCATWGQVCASEWSVCVECNADTDCKGTGKRRCWVEDHRCVACATDTDCGAGQHCVSQTGECRTACNYAGSDDACDIEGARCSDSYVCLLCDRDVECTATGRGNRCLPGAGYCVACVVDSDCNSPTSKCDTVTHACVLCKDGRDCSSGCCDFANHKCF